MHGISESDWSALVSTALVGTDREPPRPTADPGAPADPSLALLSRAVVAGLARRVGAPPERFDGTLPDPAPVDPRPLLPSAALARLRIILDSGQMYLPEWLAVMRTKGYRLPIAFVPLLLDHGSVTDVRIRADLASVLGAPGRWLAARNVAWRYLLREAGPTPDPADWHGSDPNGRLGYVAGLYLRDPAEARELVRGAWPNEKAPFKLDLLRWLAERPDPADLPLVVSFANDASKHVRSSVEQLATDLRGLALRLDFTAEVTRLAELGRKGRDATYRFAQDHAKPWPEDGTLKLLDALAYEDARSAAIHYATGSMATLVALRAPVTVRERIAAMVEQQARLVAAGGKVRVDFAAMLAIVDVRTAMLAEFAELGPES
jgi:hypothetical protein